MYYICSDCERVIDDEEPLDPEDGTTGCCWAPVLTVDDEEE